MAFTYDVSTERGQVRLLVADTDSSSPLLQDAEIDFFLSQEANIYFAAAQAAGAIAAQFYRLATSKKVGDLSRTYSDKQTEYKELQRSLTERGKGAATTSAIAPVYGGVSIDGKQAQEDNTDNMPPRFRRDQFSITAHDDDDYKGCR